MSDTKNIDVAVNDFKKNRERKDLPALSEAKREPVKHDLAASTLEVNEPGLSVEEIALHTAVQKSIRARKFLSKNCISLMRRLERISLRNIRNLSLMSSTEKKWSNARICFTSVNVSSLRPNNSLFVSMRKTNALTFKTCPIKLFSSISLNWLTPRARKM
jgi:hypothetical protein